MFLRGFSFVPEKVILNVFNTIELSTLTEHLENLIPYLRALHKPTLTSGRLLTALKAS